MTTKTPAEQGMEDWNRDWFFAADKHKATIREALSLLARVQRDPLTIRASFLCNQRMPDGSGQTCGWHGWVTDGNMVEA
jgi:hypothetical protein